MELCFRLRDGSGNSFVTAKAFSSDETILEYLTSRFIPLPHQPRNTPPLSAGSTTASVDFNERTHEQQVIGSAAAFTTSKISRFIPILCLHGWLDNASSFDLVAPSLIKSCPVPAVVIALDFPGHGLSAHLQDRSDYSPALYVRDIYSIIGQLGASWQSGLIVVGHSMGGAVANIFTSAFPELVSGLVLIENLGPFSFLPEYYVRTMHNHVLDWHRLSAKPMPVYKTLAQAEQARQRGTARGTLSADGARRLVERGIVDSVSKRFAPWDQNLPGGLTWTWRTDQKLMLPPSSTLTEDQVIKILNSIHCPVLLVLGSKGYGFDNSDQDFPWINGPVRFAAYKNIKKQIYPGGHHLHLDVESAKLIAKDIVETFCKPQLSKL